MTLEFPHVGIFGLVNTLFYTVTYGVYLYILRGLSPDIYPKFI